MHAHAAAIVEDFHVAEVPAGVHGEPFGEGLAAQAGAAAAEGERPVHLGGDPHGDAHVGGGSGPHHSVGGVQVVGCVDREGHAVEFPVADGGAAAEGVAECGECGGVAFGEQRTGCGNGSRDGH